MPNAINHRRLQLNGAEIYLRESDGGDGSYPDLLCIHGNLGSGLWFEPMMARYPGRIFAPDMPNFGQSSHIASWEIADYARWIGSILHHLELNAPVVLGHSLGGAVAMELAFQKPKQLSRLILVDSSPVDGLITPKEHYPAIEAYKADKNILAQALKTIAPTLGDEELFAQLVEDAWKMNRECFIGHAEALGRAQLREKLGNFKIPVHVFYGAMDILINEQLAKPTADFFGTEAVKLESCGHSPIVEIPDEFTEAVKSLVK
jgi:branched-chain amino acid transport system permease protein